MGNKIEKIQEDNFLKEFKHEKKSPPTSFRIGISLQFILITTLCALQLSYRKAFSFEMSNKLMGNEQSTCHTFYIN